MLLDGRGSKEARAQKLISLVYIIIPDPWKKVCKKGLYFDTNMQIYIYILFFLSFFFYNPQHIKIAKLRMVVSDLSSSFEKLIIFLYVWFGVYAPNCSILRFMLPVQVFGLLFSAVLWF